MLIIKMFLYKKKQTYIYLLIFLILCICLLMFYVKFEFLNNKIDTICIPNMSAKSEDKNEIANIIFNTIYNMNI